MGGGGGGGLVWFALREREREREVWTCFALWNQKSSLDFGRICKDFDLHLGSVWIGLILLKLKTYCWNHCSKIIFKCVNSTVGPIFNEKVAKMWNLWVHEQYMITGYCSLNSTWTVTAFYQNAWMIKKKKKKKRQNADVGGKRGSKHTHTLFLSRAIMRGKSSM